MINVVATWEYAEVAWNPHISLNNKSYWCGPGGPKTLKEHGIQTLNQAVREGWEVADYKTGEHGSTCLLRRPLQLSAKNCRA
jgi:hypothetical protein